MAILKLKFTGFDAVPADMAELTKIAARLGITRADLLRQIIKRYLHREARKAKL